MNDSSPPRRRLLCSWKGCDRQSGASNQMQRSDVRCTQLIVLLVPLCIAVTRFFLHVSWDIFWRSFVGCGLQKPGLQGWTPTSSSCVTLLPSTRDNVCVLSGGLASATQVDLREQRCTRLLVYYRVLYAICTRVRICT